ncbi:male-enhanced antigen 1-like [Xyrauchen texanus]|uniref:male-enhanced antigen 1-like n=1 Tax=Xyrauchen texanus TaxID=154827 RepID=UPI002242009E|nr:male-enhanced antigen 1-like [Xyrauchen texanus]XP_052006992.1 male-enhanced antigen 1-like [Xyrauchen texanus]XP_052006993.1 male-enhanced antigen 1-like [Xyrauchen texanus]
MEVERAREMGPERISPNSEEDVAQDRPVDTAVPEEWSGEDMEEDEGNGGYYYQPLNQDPDGMNSSLAEPADEGTTADQLQDVQERIEAMGLFLPQPPPHSDEEEDSEGAAACSSDTSIPMDADHVELVKRTMAAINLPTFGIPPWAQEISDDQWKDMVQQTLQSRQSSAGLRLDRK